MEGKRVLKNASWIIMFQCIQAVLSLIVTMLMARYLGPSNYGVLNYAISVTAFVIPIAMLGINSVLVQELVHYPDNEGEILGTSILMSICSSVLCIAGVAVFVLIANRGEKDTFIVCVLYSVMLIFQSLELIQYWYQARLLSKYTSITGLVAYIFVSTYKILLLMKGMSIHWFALSYSFDHMIISVTLLFIYYKKGNSKLKLSSAVGWRIFSKSKYYIISTLMVTLFAQQDKVMLKLMLGNEATGYYSAAVTCATMSGFIVTAIIDSVRPVIFESRLVSKAAYEQNLTSLYSIIIYFCIVQGIFFTLFAKPIIGIIYGTQYGQSVNVLQIIIWYSAFSYIGGIRDIWLLSENKQKYLIWINLFGALVNMVLNLILIRIIGICGAAFASLITQIFTNIILTFIIRPISHNNDFVFAAINPRYAIRLSKKLLSVLMNK